MTVDELRGRLARILAHEEAAEIDWTQVQYLSQALAADLRVNPPDGDPVQFVEDYLSAPDPPPR